MPRTLGLVISVSLILGSPALASGKSWRVGSDSYHIYLDDLALATAKGRAAALARVERAASRLCEPLRIPSDIRACTAKTVSSASTSARGAPLRAAMLERQSAALASR